MRLVTPGLLVCLWTLGVQAQGLAFVRPTKVDGSHYGVGSKVEVGWTTPFEHTNLEIWQGPRVDGSFAMSSLLKNASSDTTSFTWKAKPLDNVGFLPAFHFRLQKGDDENFCDGCIATSLDFHVSNMAEGGDTVLSSSNKGKSGGGLSGQDKLMIGLSVGIASAVVIAFLLLVCCTKRYLKLRWHFRRRKCPRATHPDWLAETSLLKEFSADPEDLELPSRCCSSASARSHRGLDLPKSYLEAFEFEDVHEEWWPGWEALFFNAFFDGSGPERWQQHAPSWPLVETPSDVLVR